MIKCLEVKYIVMLYISIAVIKPSGDSSAQWKAWGIPSVFVALVQYVRGGYMDVSGWLYV